MQDIKLIFKPYLMHVLLFNQLVTDNMLDFIQILSTCTLLCDFYYVFIEVWTKGFGPIFIIKYLLYLIQNWSQDMKQIINLLTIMKNVFGYTPRKFVITQKVFNQLPTMDKICANYVETMVSPVELFKDIIVQVILYTLEGSKFFNFTRLDRKITNKKGFILKMRQTPWKLDVCSFISSGYGLILFSDSNIWDYLNQYAFKKI